MDKSVIKIIKSIPKDRKLYNRDEDELISVGDVLSDKRYMESDSICPSKEHQAWYHYQRVMFRKGDAVTNKVDNKTVVYIGTFDGQSFWFLDKDMREFEDNIYSYIYANKKETKSLYNKIEKQLLKNGCSATSEGIEIVLDRFIRFNYSMSANELSLLCNITLKNGKNLIIDFIGINEHPKSFYVEFFDGIGKGEELNDILSKITLKNIRERELMIIRDIIKS